MQIIACRLIYQNADIFLIDDFFDYLTPTLGECYARHIFKYCNDNGKTVVFVSAFENMAKRSDRIFYFNNCNMLEDGTYEE